MLERHEFSRVFRFGRDRRPEPSDRSTVITGVQGLVKTRFAARISTQLFATSEPFGSAAATNGQRRREDVMNHSMYSADRATHLKIVVIGLLCATVVAVIGIFANVSGNLDLGTAALVKAGQPTTMSGQIPTVR
jgi:hypothetical protein